MSASREGIGPARLMRLSNVGATQVVLSRPEVSGTDVLVCDEAGALPHVAPSIALFLPAFNEAENIAHTIEAALQALRRITSAYKVIVVDDGSTDSTGRIAADLAGSNPDHVLVVGHGLNRGYGAALRTGFAAGLQTGCDWIGFVDADGQFDLGEVSWLLHAAVAQRAQFVAGYRIARADSWTRRQLGHAWDGLSGRIVKHGLRDVDCGFKLIHRETLLAVQLNGTYASISPELAAKVRRSGTTIAQVGVTHYPRAGGSQSGASFKVVVRSLRGLMELRREIAGESA